ncbi:nucleotidyltransferase family protein [Porifericola rhodea]|uniref:nucleotidyltransferase family protein n=1 Tax=Porifericola rhodea TaxID=930972 RepID=UPI002666B707|nr:nucleotidyltransferase family protein [Porifericola rhodea]WKN32689.1 nucleotidyltransferase family protein [Porifericola rhodea]
MSAPEQNAIIILAAGSSSRMGQPKQLLPFEGKTLLQRAAEEALKANTAEVWVVLGCNAEKIRGSAEKLPVKIVINSDWASGMGSSIRTGVHAALKSNASLEGICIMLTDQPYVNAKHLEKLIRTHSSTYKPLIASEYKGILGVPAYFHHTYFSALLQLKADQGARKLILKNQQDVTGIAFPQGITDIDTPEDYHLLKRQHNFT